MTPPTATPVEPVGACDAPAPAFKASGRTIRVPDDAKTIQAGVDRAKQGDLVLVSPGVYQESVTVGTDGVVIRGTDRNRTILDGEFERENGVFVVGADGVAVENITARNFTENGFFWNGVLGLPRARTSPRTATVTTASTRTTRSTGSSTTRTRRAAPTPASTSGSATPATR